MALVAVLLCLGILGSNAAESKELEITGVAARGKLIPVALSGFTGEAESVLKFDLYVAGFEFVHPDKAQFLITGSNAGGAVEGRLIDGISKKQRLGIRFSNGTTRAQAHALSDAIVRELTGQPGIAQTRIAFKRDGGRKSEIYVSDYDGHNAVAVTRDGTLTAAPTWVPGKLMLYYTSYKSGFPDIYSHDLVSGQRRVISKYSGLNTSPAVSPDGRKIAMVLSKAGSPDIYVANADGTGLKRLTTTKEDESSPCWSPDGSTICFVSRMSGRPRLYTIPATGGAPKALRVTGVGSATEPSWSPDGKYIAFTAMRGQFEICIVPAEGGLSETLVAGEDPSWAPNSRTIVFTRRANGKRVLSLLDVPTKHVKDVQQNLGSCSQPSWAR